MTDEPLSEAELERMEATIRRAAASIIAGFDREQIPTMIALAILGVVVGDLLDRSDPAQRRNFLECLTLDYDRGRKRRRSD